jgi:hypothetical protein
MNLSVFLRERYQQAYRAGHVFNTTGLVMQWAGGILAALLLVSAFWAEGFACAIVALAAISFGTSCFMAGLLVRAFGQLIQALVDTAVNTSSLPAEEKAQILTFDPTPRQQPWQPKWTKEELNRAVDQGRMSKEEADAIVRRQLQVAP